ncbi:MAG TPA: 50S ribosomal protein L11 methyltransferase [Burkholderiales bacterium]|nr:50S ribosomal protein L11 methyltransferase [Burkholderiales bacterium]
MAWVSVSFELAAADVEAMADALLEAGAASVDVTDAGAGSTAEQAIFAEAGADSVQPWRHSRVSALFDAGADVAALLAAASAGAGVPVPRYEIRPVAERDWVQASRDQFAPIRISPRLWIVPSWHAPPDPHAVNIRLDPGVAFGSGSHPSTRLCLLWLERVIRGGENVLDYGCGSGVLAVAAMKLGAASAVGVDIDEQALLAARRNAMHNQVQVTFHSAAKVVRRPARIVVANILAHPLVVLAPLFARLTAPRGRLALAGLLAQQADEVRGAYEPWFDFGAPEEEEGWALLSGVRRTAS